MGNKRKKGGGASQQDAGPVGETENREDRLDRDRDGDVAAEDAGGDLAAAPVDEARDADANDGEIPSTELAPDDPPEAAATAEDAAKEDEGVVEPAADDAAEEDDDADGDAEAESHPAVESDAAPISSEFSVTGELPVDSADAVEAAKRIKINEARPAWLDNDATVNLTGDLFPLPGRDDLDEPTRTSLPDELENALRARDAGAVARAHLKGLLEALIFASDSPIKSNELAKTAAAPAEEVKTLLNALKDEYAERGIQLAEVAGGWTFRTSQTYAPFVRDLTKQKPVKMSRAQIETLAILAYRQPITRPEVDEIRGVDSGATLKMLLERDIIKILGKKDEPGRPLLYGTTPAFLELFGLSSLKDLPTLREFTELNEDSRRVVERELGETMESTLGPDDGEEKPEGPKPTLAELENDGPQPVFEESAEAGDGDGEGADHEADEKGPATSDGEEEAAAEAPEEDEEEVAEGDSDDDFDDDDEDSEEEPEPEG